MNKTENQERLTVINLAGGAAIEAVDDEIQRVIENILDPNCDPARKRTVTLKLVFQPTKDNANLFGVAIQAESKIVPPNAVVTTAYADHDAAGTVCASELRPGMRHDQGNMLDYAKDKTIDVSPVSDEAVVDPETGEVYEQETEVIDFRQRAAGGK